ncbi:MAG TPA: FecR domain-containing protein [Acidiferrobacterales bacterium]
MRWQRLMLGCLALGFGPAASGSAVGTFTEIEGEVRLLRGEYYFAAAPGVEVAEDDIVETGARARAQIEMGDGSILRLGPDTRLALAEYRLADDRSVVSAGVELLSGWLRFAVAKLRQGADYRIDTPTMAIGIRGTEGVIEAGAEDGRLLLEEGVVQVALPGPDPAAVQRVQAGEFIQRAYGRPFQRPAAPPAAFRQRLPANFERPAAPRLATLKQRAVAPRALRPVGQSDVKRYLDKHPHMRDKFRERFEQRLTDDPAFRERIKQRREQRRDFDPRRKPDGRDRPGAGGFAPRAPGAATPDQAPGAAPGPLRGAGKPRAPFGAGPASGSRLPQSPAVRDPLSKPIPTAPALQPPATGVAPKPASGTETLQKPPGMPILEAPLPAPDGQIQKPPPVPTDEAVSSEKLLQDAPEVQRYQSVPPPTTRLPQLQTPLQRP